MPEYIGGAPPASKTISLTKGTDKPLPLYRRDPNGTKDENGKLLDPVDWDATVYMDIDGPTPTRIQASVTNDLALIRIESTICDTLNSEKWRIIVSQPGSPSLETPLFRGKFQRND